VHEDGARLPDPLCNELAIAGESRRRSNTAPDNPVAVGEHSNSTQKRCGRHVPTKTLKFHEVTSHCGAEPVGDSAYPTLLWMKSRSF
jgi:hypothetical protein